MTLRRYPYAALSSRVTSSGRTLDRDKQRERQIARMPLEQPKRGWLAAIFRRTE